MAIVILEASYSGANLAAPAVIPIDIPLPAGTVTAIDVAVKTELDGGDATFNFYLNSLTPLATGVDRWIIPDGDKIFSKTGLSQVAVRGDYLELRLEAITGGAIAFEPIMIYVTYEDETNFDDVYVSLTEDQDVDGVKTFLDSPLVPDPTTALQATSKAYVDAAVASVTGNQPTISALVSGGIVSWISALQFQVSAAVYYIQGVLYEAAAQTVTLDAADATDDRIDVLALDTTGDFVKITGTPASEPNEPDYDPATQLKLTFVIVPAMATEPDAAVSDEIYQENTEWTSATSGSGFNAASTSNPFAGSKDIEGTSVTANSYVQLTRSSPIDADDYSVLAFYIRSKASWGANRFLRFQFYLSGVAKGSPVTVKTGYWGFDDSNTSSYQFIGIPLTQFVIPPGTQIDRLRITGVGSGGTFGFYLDEISVRNAGTSGTVTQGLTQEQADVRYLQLSGGTLSGDLVVPAEAYGGGWNGSNEVPTKNDLYDKIETVIAGSGLAQYDAADSAAPGSLYFAEDTDNGSNKVTVIAPASIASDKTQTLQDASGTLALTADIPPSSIGKQTIYIPASAMIPATTSGPASAQLEAAGGQNYSVLDFDATADEFAHFQIAFPKSWNEGTITYQVFWSSTATDTDGVAWALEGAAKSDNEAITGTWGTPVVVTDDAQSAAAELYVTAESSAVTIGGSPAADDLIFFRLSRDVSDGNDDMTEDARLIGIKLLYTTDAGTDA